MQTFRLLLVVKILLIIEGDDKKLNWGKREREKIIFWRQCLMVSSYKFQDIYNINFRYYQQLF